MNTKSIAQNTMWMTVASVGQKIISFAYFTIIARSVGVENTGKYFFALSFTTIFVVFVDLGLTSVLVREGAKAKDKIQNYFSTVLAVKILLGFLTYLAAVAVINIMGYQFETRHLVYLSAVTMLFDSIHLSIYGMLRVFGDLRYEAVGTISSQLLTMVLGTVFIFFDLPLVFLIAAFTIPSFCNVCYSGIVLIKKYNISPLPRFDSVVFKFMFAIAVPFALTSIFTRVYGYIDSVILSKLAGDAAVGWYSIPYKITYAFQFIPFALTASLFPRFSEYFVYDRQKLARVFENAMKYLMLIVFPISIGIIVLARDVVMSVFTAQYANSVVPLQILMLSLIFAFLSAPITTLLNACNKQVTQMVIIGCVMCVNIASNLVLIPHLGVTGAAISALLGNFLIFFIGYFFVPKITSVSHVFLLKCLVQICISAVIMGLVVHMVGLRANFVVAIVVGAIFYCASIFVVRSVTKNDLLSMIKLIKS